MHADDRYNWGGNLKFNRTNDVVYAQTRDDVKTFAAESGLRKVLGTGHSFSNIADTHGLQISLRDLTGIKIDVAQSTVTIEAGVRYGELAQVLQRAGLSLHNLASLPHISVAGACSTATHGSGDKNGNLATAVTAMRIIDCYGNEQLLSRENNGQRFLGAVVGLGGLGIVTELTLAVAPTFEMRQEVYQGFKLSHLIDTLDDIMSTSYSVSIFTNWEDPKFNQVWIKRVVTDALSPTIAPVFFGGTPAPANVHPIVGESAENCTEQMGINGPWFERLPHFRLDHKPSTGDELQSEYFVPRTHASQALRKIEKLKKRIAPHLLISAIRTVAADDLWMSPCYKQSCIGIHFTWKNSPSTQAALPEILKMIERELEDEYARPHWAKLFEMKPERLPALYERFSDFKALVEDFDKEKKFRNSFLDRYVFNGEVSE